jgi:Ankyrin repeats (many copies)
MSRPSKADPVFQDALMGLRRGDFSRLEPLLDGGGQCRIVDWHRMGLFDDEPEALAEAFSCACFLGRTEVAEYLLDHGVDPLSGSGTGMNAFHWAANRGQLETTRMLIRRGVPLEIRNDYGGTVLGATVWAAIHEPKADHLAIIDALIQAGANLDEVEYPTGNEPVDEMLQRHGKGA